MNINVTIDYKFIAVLGMAVVSTIFAMKMDGTAAEKVLTLAVSGNKELAIA